MSTQHAFVFTSRDRGCHADGAFGHDHVRQTLASLLDYAERAANVPCATARDRHILFSSLRGPMPDDAWDEYEAIDKLQEHTADGLCWTFEAGDLLLLVESET